MNNQINLSTILILIVVALIAICVRLNINDIAIIKQEIQVLKQQTELK